MGPLREMGRHKLRKMKSISLETPTFLQQNQDVEPAWPDSKVLSSTTCCAREANNTPETSPREGRGGAILEAGRLVIKAWKIHDVLGNRTDNSPHVAKQWNRGAGAGGPASYRPGHLSSSRANPGRRAAAPPPAPEPHSGSCGRQPCFHQPSLSQPVTTLVLAELLFAGLEKHPAPPHRTIPSFPPS